MPFGKYFSTHRVQAMSLGSLLGCVVGCNCKWRFYDPRALKELLSVRSKNPSKASEENQVRLKLIADRKDVKALEAKRNHLDRLRKGCDLAATGDVCSHNEDAAMEDAEDADVDRLQRKRPKLDQPS
jgi:hypothetical protein